MKQSVTVLVATYNADWTKLRATLRSVLRQKGVQLQIVMADDGSAVRWDKEILELCQSNGFENIVFSNLPQNKGTVINVYEAIQYVQGKYCKMISPGDCLYGENVLCDWIAYMQEKKAKISFGDAVYYSVVGNEKDSVYIHKNKKSPRNTWVYNQKSRRPLFVDYLLINDFILGASLFGETELLKDYLSQIVGRIRYAEDHILRLMVFDGVKVLYYPSIVIWYEYGTGISTNGQSIWAQRLKEDTYAGNQILLERESMKGSLNSKFAHFLRKDFPNALVRKISKCIMFPDIVFYRIYQRLNKRGTVVRDTSELEMLLANNPSQ